MKVKCLFPACPCSGMSHTCLTSLPAALEKATSFSHMRRKAVFLLLGQNKDSLLPLPPINEWLVETVLILLTNVFISIIHSINVTVILHISEMAVFLHDIFV